MGPGVPDAVPVEETRGGEVPGDWRVAARAASQAASVAAKVAVIAAYMKNKHGEGHAE